RRRRRSGRSHRVEHRDNRRSVAAAGHRQLRREPGPALRRRGQRGGERARSAAVVSGADRTAPGRAHHHQDRGMRTTGRRGRGRGRGAARAFAFAAVAAIAQMGAVQTGGAQTGAAQTDATPQGAGAARAPQPAGNDLVTLNFRDAEIDSVIGAFGHLLDRTFVIDPRVRGKMTLETPRPVSREQAYRLLQSALRSQGFAIVEADALTKVVPEADAKLQSGPVSAGRAPTVSGDQIVTQIFRLNYESATNLVPVLRPLISPNNTVVAYPNNNSLVVTD